MNIPKWLDLDCLWVTILCMVSWQILPLTQFIFFYFICFVLLLACKILAFHFSLFVWSVGEKKQTNSRFLIKAKQIFTIVKESGKPGLLQSLFLYFFSPNWSSSLNSSPIGGFVVQLNLTLSNNLPAAVMRYIGKYLWLLHTDAFGADGKFVLLSPVTIEGTEQLITSAWPNTLNVDCNEQTLQMVYSFTLCYKCM